MLVNFFRLIRVKHYVKNFFIFLPLFFSSQFNDGLKLLNVFYGFLIFSLSTSIVYIFNDIKDVKKDREHPTKKLRPLASSELKVAHAYAIIIIIILLVLIFSYLTLNLDAIIFLAIYIVLNYLYSIKLKEVPLIDVSIIAFGFVLRILYGGALINVQVSNWLILTILSFSYYMAFGKRRNELIINGTESRSVLKNYNLAFLNQSILMFQTLFIVFYAMWTIIGVQNLRYSNLLIWTIPLLVLIVLKYSMMLENNETGDPAEMLFSDVVLLSLSSLFAAVIFIIYFF